jgi:hypothetical protein
MVAQCTQQNIALQEKLKNALEKNAYLFLECDQ